MEPIILNEENFNSYIAEHKGMALVDFWATWCAPCRMMSPILDELAEETGEDQLVAKVNVDMEQHLAHAHKVMSIPTLILFKDGVEVNRFVGVTSKETLKNALKGE